MTNLEIFDIYSYLKFCSFEILNFTQGVDCSVNWTLILVKYSLDHA